MTLVVYLDTSDYINIFNENPPGDYNHVLEDLIRLRQDGDAAFYFSFFSVVEFITKPDLKNRSERVRRGDLLKFICGSNAFPHVWDIKDSAALPNDGRWFLGKDDVLLSGANFRKSAKANLYKIIKSHPALNRETRRKFLSASGVNEMMNWVGSNWGRTRADYGDLPVSEEFVRNDYIRRLLRGEITDVDFEKAVVRWVMDPSEYSRIVYEYADRPNFTDKFFGEILNQLRSATDGLAASVESVKELNQKQLAMRQNLRKVGIDHKLARRLTKQTSIDNDKIALEWYQKASAQIGERRSGHFLHYFKKLVSAKIRFKHSDFMDLMHLCYAYDCDFFRTDAAMASNLKDYEPFRGKLVSKFHSLPTVLRRGQKMEEEIT